MQRGLESGVMSSKISGCTWKLETPETDSNIHLKSPNEKFEREFLAGPTWGRNDGLD